ncbi:hypothetical protein [Gordonia insulae]|uniref:Uncharacterized protein n=1 Tax=Gordonia insulae TaxID=2420509 RepID=A0A3G8JRL6_9ACTN|nr:hypothetical protein [Gordonia insulae]AZG47536.1 hypothetical protein D7316_04147 [Gordonia insulae]
MLISDSYTDAKWEHRRIAEKCMSGSPSAVFAYDKAADLYRLYVYYHGYGEDGSLHVNTFDGHNWSGDRLIGAKYLYGSPSAVVVA